MIVILYSPSVLSHEDKWCVMKVMMRSIMKILPGKMAEALELEKKHMAIGNRILGIYPKIYMRFSGNGDTMRTIIIEVEFNSFTDFESYPAKMAADPEMQKISPKLGALIDTVDIELYTPVTYEQG